MKIIPLNPDPSEALRIAQLKRALEEQKAIDLLIEANRVELKKSKTDNDGNEKTVF